MTRHFFIIVLLAAVLCGLSQAAPSVTYTQGFDGGAAHQFRNPCKVTIQADPALSYSKTLYLNQQSYAFPAQAKPAPGWKAVSAKYLADFTPGSEVTINLGNSITPVSFQIPSRLFSHDGGFSIVTVRFASLRRNPDGSPEHQDDVFVYVQVIPNLATYDGNGNSLYDLWEMTQFGSLGGDPNADPDQDELSNLQEMQQGTQPNAWDTDGDDLADGNDPNPLIQNPSAPPGFYVAIPDVEENNPEVDYTKIKLRWQPSAYNPTGYRIERRIESAEWQQLASVTVGITQYADQNLLANQHYQYRITAYRDMGDQQILSESVYADYDVPMLLSFEVKQSSLTRSKDSQGGFLEFTNPSNPPKLYLKKTESWSYSNSYSDSNSSSDNTASYVYVSTIDPQAKTKTYHGEYHYTHNDFFEVNYPDNGNSDWSHETEASTYDRTEKSRSRSRLQSETTESYTSTYDENGGASAWWFGGGSSSGTHWQHEDINESYLYQALYMPNGGGAPRWNGDDYDLANGMLRYSGQAAYSKVHTESNPIYNHNESESLMVNPATGGWVGGWPTFTGWPKYKSLPKPNQTVTNTTQTVKTFSNPPGTSELTQEYTTQAFTNDTITDLPDYPNVWTKSWVGGSDNLSSVLSYSPKAWRYLSNNETYLDVKKFKYRMKASPSVPYILQWYEVFVPEDNPNTPVNESENVEFKQRSWTLGGSLNISPEFEVADATTKPKNGSYALVPVDIDFIHPATGEMTESREESEGGYIAIRKGEETPVTKLLLHKLDGVAAAQFKLTWTSNKIKIWKDENRTQAVTSDQTTFPANADTELFLEGVAKSASAKEVEIGLKVIFGPTESSSITVKATVVQSEYNVTIQAFIPYLWIDVPLNWTSAAWDEVAIGDNRIYDPTLNQTYRARQWFTVTPFKDLTAERIKPSSVKGKAGLSIHYDKSDSVPVAEQGEAHGYSFDANPHETREGEGTTDLPIAGNVQELNLKKFSFHAHMAAWEGVLGPMISEPIVWNLTFGFDVSNPVLTRVLISGTRKGFPAYEIYVSDSEDENQPIYRWTPSADRYLIPHLFWIEEIAPNQPLELLVP